MCFRLGFSSGCSYGVSMSVDSGEVYPSAPLALVAAEVRYPEVAEGGLGMAVHRRIRDALGSDWVVRPEPLQTFEAVVGDAGPRASLRSETVGRITSRKRTRIITALPGSFTVEVVDYASFADFRDLLERAAAAVGDVLEPDGVTRVGLRYIDEIASPEPAQRWGRWLDASLMAPSLPSGLTPAEWMGAVQYKTAPEHSLVLRYSTSDGPVVSPDGPLKRPKVPQGPIFVLDFDSSWQPGDIPAFTAERITGAAERLRAPLRELFDSLVPPALLEIFRQNPNND